VPVTTTALVAPAVSGFLLGGSLIIAIGAQNAFVLRQGLLRAHVLPVVAICVVSDALLIGIGVAGLGSIIGANADLLNGLLIVGSGYLFVYGAVAFRHAFSDRSMAVADRNVGRLWPTLAACLAFTWGNPHVYLDTVVLLGGLAGQYQPVGRVAFGVGAVVASTGWFFGLGYGARALAPLFARPGAWRVLDSLIGCVMWAMAARLVAQLY
jgi:L-lysine exporter family protein LysE/ArgO